uniref:Uncharacterized protein n=1 Tax=Panagrolaimus sp. JU765 TaxID=591449 RepID=A0AC34QTQ8_9BILA
MPTILIMNKLFCVTVIAVLLIIICSVSANPRRELEDLFYESDAIPKYQFHDDGTSKRYVKAFAEKPNSNGNAMNMMRALIALRRY